MTDFPKATLEALMRDQGLNALAIVPGPTFQWITGAMFKLLERPKLLLVPLGGRPVMLIPALEKSRWDGLGIDADVVTWTDNEGFHGAFAKLAEMVPATRIGVEGLTLRYQEFSALTRAFPQADMRDVQRATQDLRLAKTEDEVEKIRRAIGWSEAALDKTFSQVRAGMLETEVQSLLFNALLEHPLKEVPECVCTAGAQTAQPHGRARPDYRIRPGDALLIDFAIRADGYYSDITRTVFVEEVSDADRKFYETVEEANRLGREASRPGITADALDDIVLRHLEDEGYAEYIIHKTGHGLGLDVHEPPMVMRGNDEVLLPGMVFTVEPGLYDTSRLGVRIEDDLLLTEDGRIDLTTFPRELTIVGS